MAGMTASGWLRIILIFITKNEETGIVLCYDWKDRESFIENGKYFVTFHGVGKGRKRHDNRGL
ncbi:MAG: hypothetical protein LUC90_03560, partial [Lachnospiraceae bacterium]|nr:hypothetical protein [Lachnospiraceae bacterium]